MPSPESPAKRRTTRSSSRVGCSGAAVSVKVWAPGRVGCELLLLRRSAYRQVPPRRVFWVLRPTRSPGRRVEDLLDRLVQGGVEVGVALLGREAFGERPREAGDHPLV